MIQESAVQFATESRIHIALGVKDLEASIAFYQTLFGQEASKTRPRYAKFEVPEPPVNLALNEIHDTTEPNNSVAHFGIQVKSSEAVQRAIAQFTKAGMATTEEKQTTCCYAVQNKVWATDPDGNKWEVYVVLDNDGAHHHSSENQCCPDLPAIMDAVRIGDLGAARTAFEKAGGMSACGCLSKAGT